MVRPAPQAEISNSLTTQLPTAPGKVALPPARLVPTTRPWRLAMEPSGKKPGLPVIRLGMVTQSPPE